MNSMLSISSHSQTSDHDRSPTPSDHLVSQLKLVGRLDATTVGQLERVLTDAQLAGSRALVVDMGDLTYVSSSGLRILLSARSAARKRGGDMFLCALGRNVREVFDMVGFSAVFSIFDTCEQAVEAANKLVNQ